MKWDVLRPIWGDMYGKLRARPRSSPPMITKWTRRGGPSTHKAAAPGLARRCGFGSSKEPNETRSEGDASEHAAVEVPG